jgi:hypothetical protein
MTSKILRCQELWADKTLSFWCMLNRKTNDWCETIYYVLDRCTFWSRRYWISSVPFWSMDLEFDEDMISRWSWDIYEIVWHPITYWQICYIRYTNINKIYWIEFLKICEFLEKDVELYKKTILERPDELVDLVLSFLESLWKK